MWKIARGGFALVSKVTDWPLAPRAAPLPLTGALVSGVLLAGCADVPGGTNLRQPIATGPGAAEINCANDVRLRRASARVHRADLVTEQRGAVYASAPGSRSFVCFTDQSGAVVNVREQRRRD